MTALKLLAGKSVDDIGDTTKDAAIDAIKEALMDEGKSNENACPR